MHKLGDVLAHLIKMTPLSWSADHKRIEQVFNAGIEHINADFTVIIGKRLGKALTC